jgi:hypothetical protein
MKLTSKILTAMLLIFIAGLFISNSILKNEYDKADKMIFTGTMVKFWNSHSAI